MYWYFRMIEFMTSGHLSIGVSQFNDMDLPSAAVLLRC